ncbi:MAG: DUF2065 domain-containing protein [Hyphomicrobium sp.]
MNDLIAGLGVALVLEGALWALAPNLARKMLSEMASIETGRLQAVALAVSAAGVFLVWMARG